MTSGHAVRPERPVLSDVQLLTENTLRYKPRKYISCVILLMKLFLKIISISITTSQAVSITTQDIKINLKNV
jgi:hypothetical protein